MSIPTFTLIVRGKPNPELLARVVPSFHSVSEPLGLLDERREMDGDQLKISFRLKPDATVADLLGVSQL